MNTDNEINLTALPKHTYPLWIKAFLLTLLTIIIAYNVKFLLLDFSLHREIKSKIGAAEYNFFRKNYALSFEQYLALYTKYPNFREAKMRSIEAIFALSNKNETNFFIGVKLMCDDKYKVSEIDRFKEFIPSKYRETFDSIFQKVS